MPNARPKICGIYGIYSAINDTIYVGYSADITRRWRDHRAALNRKDKKCNKHLQNAWDLYGEEAFEFYTLEECAVELLHIREQYHLDLHPRNYNWGPCAASPRRGVPHTDETKAKIGDASRGRKHTDEARSKMSVAATGRKATDETRAINSERMKGNTYAAGYVRSSESKERIIEALTGRPVSEETREKLRVALTGREFSDEARAKMSDSAKAREKRVVTPEAKENMRVAALAREARKREAKKISQIKS